MYLYLIVQEYIAIYLPHMHGYARYKLNATYHKQYKKKIYSSLHVFFTNLK